MKVRNLTRYDGNLLFHNNGQSLLVARSGNDLEVLFHKLLRQNGADESVQIYANGRKRKRPEVKPFESNKGE